MGKISPLRTVQELYAQSNRSRKKVKREFVAHDGEGITTDSHKYVLLMNSKGKQLIDTNGIDTYDALKFLTESSLESKDAIHVMYGASYDVNMILKDVSYPRLKKLQAGEKVGFNNFVIEYRQRKCFMVSEYLPDTKHYVLDEKDKWKSTHIARITLWDVIGFFQGKFTKALQEFFPALDDQERLYLSDILLGKEERGTFTKERLKNFVIPYTGYEVKALVALMDKFRFFCEEAGINLRRYDGAGAIAAALLEKYGVKKYYGTPIYIPKKRYTKGEIPYEVGIASQHSYGGGRVEMPLYGYGEEIDNGDIISAYPSVMPELYDLSNGKWYNHKKHIHMSNYFSLYKIYWQYPDNLSFYPFFYRDIGGVIRYPKRGYSWVWYPELKAALKYQKQMQGKINIYEQWEYVPENDFRPYNFVTELYQKRKEWKEAGNGAQICLKLGINSFYGKTVQRLGYDEKTGKIPPFFQIQYGGYITSKIRARMFEAAMQYPDDIIAFATDGIWSRKKLSLDIGQELGQWERKSLKSLTMIQAGVYFATLQDGKSIHHYRGFNEDSITEEAILKAWNRASTITSLGEVGLPIKTKRFVTLGTGITSVERYKTKWRTWEEEDRVLRLKPSITEKRYDEKPWSLSRNPSSMLLRTQVTEAENMSFASENKLKDEHLSLKHELPWEQEIDVPDIAYNEDMQEEIWETDV
jgi:hypothetical protein